MNIDIFESFDACASYWRAFEAKTSHHGFLSFDWLSTWQKTIGASNATKPLIVLLSHDADVKMILPFGIRPYKKIFKVLCWLGAGTTDYMGPLWDSHDPSFQAASWPDLWNAVIKAVFAKKKFDGMKLDNIPDVWANAVNPMMHLSPLQAKGYYSFSKLDQPSFEDFYQLRSKNLRQDSKRQRERLLKTGGSLSFKIASTPEEGLKWLPDLFTFKSQRYKEMKVPDLFASKSFRDFYTSIFLLKTSLPHLSALTCGEENIALHLGLFHQKRFYYLLPAHAVAWGKYSPGRILLEELIRWTFAQKGEVFDFTLGAEAYKKDWCSHTQRLFQKKQGVSFLGKMLF